MYEPVQTTSRKLLCLEQAVTGDDGMARYNVRWTDSRELDVSGATGPVINSTSKDYSANDFIGFVSHLNGFVSMFIGSS